MTMPSATIAFHPPRPLRADARRNYERLLHAARETFDECGAETCLDEIARRAEVGIGTLYRHFPTRRALLEAVLHDGIVELNAMATQLLDAPAPGEALATWLRAVLAHAVASRGLAVELQQTMSDGGPPSLKCEEMRSLGARLLIRAQAAGDVRDDVDATDLLALVNGIAWATGQPAGDRNHADRLLSLMLDGLRRGDRVIG